MKTPVIELDFAKVAGLLCLLAAVALGAVAYLTGWPVAWIAAGWMLRSVVVFHQPGAMPAPYQEPDAPTNLDRN